MQSLHSVGVVTISFSDPMPYLVWYPLIIILHGFSLHFSFFFLILHAVCIMRIMGYALVGGLILLFMYYHHFMCSLWSLCYIFLHLFFSSMFCVLISSFFCAPEFSFLLFVCFLHTWLKTFGGCGCICFICSHMCVLKCVYLTYFAIVDTIGQDSNVKHVVF